MNDQDLDRHLGASRRWLDDQPGADLAARIDERLAAGDSAQSPRAVKWVLVVASVTALIAAWAVFFATSDRDDLAQAPDVLLAAADEELANFTRTLASEAEIYARMEQDVQAGVDLVFAAVSLEAFEPDGGFIDVPEVELVPENG